MVVLPKRSTPLISKHLLSILMKLTSDKICSNEEGNKVDESNLPDGKVNKRESSRDELPLNVANQVCREIHKRGTGTPIMFHHRSKYYVTIASACGHEGDVASVSKVGRDRSTSNLQAPVEKLPCGFRMFDDILEGPGGHVWKQAIEFRIGPVKTVELKGNSYIWFPIRPPNVTDNKKEKTSKGTLPRKTRKVFPKNYASARVQWKHNLNDITYYNPNGTSSSSTTSTIKTPSPFVTPTEDTDVSVFNHVRSLGAPPNSPEIGPRTRIKHSYSEPRKRSSYSIPSSIDRASKFKTVPGMSSTNERWRTPVTHRELLMTAQTALEEIVSNKVNCDEVEKKIKEEDEEVIKRTVFVEEEEEEEEEEERKRKKKSTYDDGEFRPLIARALDADEESGDEVKPNTITIIAVGEPGVEPIQPPASWMDRDPPKRQDPNPPRSRQGNWSDICIATILSCGLGGCNCNESDVSTHMRCCRVDTHNYKLVFAIGCLTGCCVCGYWNEWAGDMHIKYNVSYYPYNIPKVPSDEVKKQEEKKMREKEKIERGYY